MLPITKDYLQSKCEIKTLESITLGKGILEGVEEGIIQIRKTDDFLPTLSVDTVLKINVTSQSMGNKTLIGKVYLSTPDLMRIADVLNLSDFERRSFFRLRLHIYTQAYPVHEGSEQEQPIELFQVILTDLSISGCFIETRKKMEMNDRFMIALPLSDVRTYFTCQVQRNPKIDGKGNGYGCKFLNTTSRQNDLLCEYLFDKQREQIKQIRRNADSQE